MRGPNAYLTLRATSSRLVILVFLISALSSVCTRTVENSRHHHHHHYRHETRETIGVPDESKEPASRIQPLSTIDDKLTEDGYAEQSLSVEDRIEEEGGNEGSRQNNRQRISKGRDMIDAGGKSKINSSSTSSVIKVPGSIVDQEGIRRFDAVVVNGESAGKILDSETDKSKDRELENSAVDKTVSKGIIVRDGPGSSDEVPGEQILDGIPAELSERKTHQKRSLSNSPLVDAHKTPESENAETEELRASGLTVEEGKVDSNEPRIISELVPLATEVTAPTESPPHHELVADGLDEKVEARLPENPEKPDAPVIEPVETESGELPTIEQTKSISDLDIAHERSIDKFIASDDDQATKDAAAPMVGKIIGSGNHLLRNEKDEKAQLTNSETISSRSKDDNDQDETHVDAETTTAESSVKVTRHHKADPASLSGILKTNISLDELKAQAIALQASLKDETFLQRLREENTVILPQIPKFTESQLYDALHTIGMMKEIGDDEEYSHLSKVDTSMLSTTQLDILKCAEALVVREQRQTFAENMFECIRSLSVLNCMRIFVWPIIADNIPQSFTQNLPTLPIEVNIADLLPGNQRYKPKNSRLRSQQTILITPELLVSNILKEALSAKPQDTSNLPNFIDSKNETLSKLLTAGQLEILRMAEMFLPESLRHEYSEKMSSCVQRFEYFSCVKYFAWPMVKQHFTTLPDFPDYQSWYPNVSLYPGYPIVPYPTTEGIGELPEIVEADATRASHPRPETVIVQILANTLKQVSGVPHYQPGYYLARYPATPVPTLTADQMAIFYTAEQLIPEAMRSEFISKTMKCIRDYDYLTCTKYSTWPAVRQLYPGLPQFPDFSSWIPTFALPDLPDFSQYLPDFGSYLPTFPGFPGIGSGQQQPQPQPAPQPQPQPQPEEQTQPQPVPDKPPNEAADSTIISKEDNKVLGPENNIESSIIRILSNIKLVVLPRNSQSIPPITQGTLATLNNLSYNQLRILALSKNVIPAQVRGDLDARFVGCLQGGSDFLNCTRNVIWPTLQLYVKNLPSFPQEEKPKVVDFGLSESFAITPAIYQPIFRSPGELAGRSPIGSQIIAESGDELPPLNARTSVEIPVNVAESQLPVAQLGQGIIEKSSDSPIPLITVTDARFTPIFSERPETVLLKILTNVRTSSKLPENLQAIATSTAYTETFSKYLSPNELSIIQASENLLPLDLRPNFIEKMSECSKDSNFMVCTRDILWPTLTQHYPRLPSFPNFNISDESTEGSESLPPKKVSFVGAALPAISETDVKTGQHGDAMVTITDTRFVPIFSEHPETSILGILKNLEASLPALSGKQTNPAKAPEGSSEFAATFTDQQGNIITIAGNLLPESIRDVFNKRMAECMRENGFLDCTRDIAWPTIAQFFPRLPNFPNIGALPEPSVDKKPSQQPTFLPPNLESVGILGIATSSKPSLPLPTENFIPVTPEDEFASRIESILKQISSVSNIPQRPKPTHLNANDPLVGSRLTEKQSSVVKTGEDLLPDPIKPIFVARMVECSRLNVFAYCMRNVGWPTLRQFLPSLPDFSDLGSILPQIPQDIPEIPQLPNFPIPSQIPNIPSINIPGQSFFYPFRAVPEGVSHREAAYVTRGSLYAERQPDELYINGISGLTSSVDSSSTASPGGRAGTPGDSSVVRAENSSSQSSGVSGESATKTLVTGSMSEGRRKKRSLDPDLPHDFQDISTDNIDLVSFNMTEQDFLELLVNITQRQDTQETRNPDDYFVESLNGTMKEALTDEQYRILKIVQDINRQTFKAGYMAKIMQCIRSLSFIRCMTIFVWPVITQNFPSLPSFPSLGGLNPFGRYYPTDNFQLLFGITSDDFEREVLRKKKDVEGVLIDWYRSLMEDKFDKIYGYVRLRGYGDGEIGISFNSFKGRTGRAAKIKDNKNLPSILTIISDIMEDMLEQRDYRPESDRYKEQMKKMDRSRRAKSLVHDRFSIDDYNEVSIENSRQDTSNDDKIIAMFLDKLRTNLTSDIDANPNERTKNYLNAPDAYEAFELLFGTKLSDRMAERLDILSKQDSRTYLGKDRTRKMSEKSEQDQGSDDDSGTRIRSGLTLRLPRIDEEFLSRKLTSSLTDLGRKMKVQMSQVVPGISFVLSFFVQMMLAHARAAASVAGMMSNMALASAMFSMIRQTLFGSTNNPKIKYVYDNSAMGPGITWPHYHHP